MPITNHHVINGCKEVRFAERESPAKIVTSDAINDLSLLLVEGIKVVSSDHL
jgi:S1-C subfamily serine protease